MKTRMVVVEPTMETQGGYNPHLVYRGSTEIFVMRHTVSVPLVWGPSLQDAQAAAAAYNEEQFMLSTAECVDILRSIQKAKERERDGLPPQPFRISRDG